MKETVKQITYGLNVIADCLAEDMLIIQLSTGAVAVAECTKEKFKLGNIKGRQIVIQDLYNLIGNAEEIDNIQKELGRFLNSSERKQKMYYNKINEIEITTSDGKRITVKYKAITRDGNKYLICSVYNIAKTGLIDTITSLDREIRIGKYIDNIEYSTGFMMLIGIDNFNNITDLLGYTKCNEVLTILSNSIKDTLHSDKGIFRCDGDEILVIRKNTDFFEPQDIWLKLSSKFTAEVKRKFNITVTISCGIDSFEDLTFKRYDTVKERLKFALHRAKLQGKASMEIYKDEEFNIFERSQRVKLALDKAIANSFEGFELYFQPIWDLRADRISGAEALLRWNSEEYGLVYPSEIIPVLERTGMIQSLGKWIIIRAMDQVSKWREYCDWFKINTNISCVQLTDDSLGAVILQLKQLSNIDSSAIVIEITESTEMEQGENSIANKIIADLKEANFKIALDDFGTGYSNLNYLHTIGADIIKFDKEFIDRACENSYDFNIIKHITQLAHDEGIRVVYEGVETEEQLDILRKLDPDYIQGYYYGKPQSAIQFEINYINKYKKKPVR